MLFTNVSFARQDRVAQLVRELDELVQDLGASFTDWEQAAGRVAETAFTLALVRAGVPEGAPVQKLVAEALNNPSTWEGLLQEGERLLGNYCDHGRLPSNTEEVPSFH